ncbi:MAG TPA: LytTR family DNA-binding domain-containing protein [Mobilitalea sp.]|nr:LytTR family DNA-binding domain-containing protein [Mobilitalea sp.]
MKINMIVCDDESIALKINCTYIEELAKKYKVDANVAGFSNGEKVLEYMENNEIDIAFLDIDLKGLSGLTVASKILKKNPRVITIFVTAHREFAYEAFTVEAFSYLAKPIDPERLERVFKKAILQVNDINNRLQRVPLVITEGNIKRKISQSSIIYIERVNSQSIIITKTGKHSVYETITSLASRLEENFLQINQGTIVNLEEVAVIKGNQVKMKTGDLFSVGRTFSKEVKKKYLNYPRI